MRMTTRRSLFSIIAGAIGAIALPKLSQWPESRGMVTAYVINAPANEFLIKPGDPVVFSNSDLALIQRLREAHESITQHFLKWGDDFPAKTLWLEAAERLEELKWAGNVKMRAWRTVHADGETVCYRPVGPYHSFEVIGV
jgi:hypothetical protein